MIEQGGDLPNWLCDALVLDSLPWEFGREWSYLEFEEKYTLHDSQWVGVFTNLRYDSSITLALIWDAHWLPSEVYEPTPVVNAWPLLFIKLEVIETISTKDLVALNYQREVESSRLIELDNDQKVLTVVGDGGEIEFRFRGKMIFLALDREKSPLSI
jgi:hypothetical protein